MSHKIHYRSSEGRIAPVAAPVHSSLEIDEKTENCTSTPRPAADSLNICFDVAVFFFRNPPE